MIEYLKDYEGNALEITDEQVATDWRLGLIRSLAKVVAGQAAPTDSTGPYGSTIPGSNRDHVQGSFGNNTRCELVAIYNLREEGGERYEFDSFGGKDYNVLYIYALADCKCGRLQKYPVQMDISPGDLIGEVMRADRDF